MIDAFKRYIRQRDLIGADDRILIGVSGGADSMTLLELMRQCYPADRIAVAHCNFGLRAEESDGDEALVRQRCAEHGITFYVTLFDTSSESQRGGESIQMAARRLRYDWFDSLCDQHGYSKVAIAHHADDSVETFFINLMRGTGLRGLTGISNQRGRIVRPLLFSQRDEIVAYATQNGVDYRDDSTNSSVKYLRNKIRHDIIPRFSTSSRIFSQTMEENLMRLQESQRFVDFQVDKLRAVAVRDNVIDLSVLDSVNLQFELYELLRPYGFVSETSRELARIIRTHERDSDVTASGKQFFAREWVATLDRGRVLLTRLENKPFVEELLEQDDPRVEWLTVSELPDSLVTLPNVAYLCADSLKFPLQLRLWQEGDWFIPLGMVGQKRVSDFLIDVKVPVTEKSRQGVLLSGQTIVWLTGRRIDDRYKVTQSASRILRITL